MRRRTSVRAGASSRSIDTRDVASGTSPPRRSKRPADAGLMGGPGAGLAGAPMIANRSTDDWPRFPPDASEPRPAVYLWWPSAAQATRSLVMPGSCPAGPLGTGGVTLTIDEGTLARAISPAPGTVGAGTSVAQTTAAAPLAVDASGAGPAIEALNLRGAARAAAYALKKAHPAVKFTSGRRNKADQARAMASNVIHNRNWIEDTYAASTVSKACQKWVDGHPDAKTQDEIAAGLL